MLGTPLLTLRQKDRISLAFKQFAKKSQVMYMGGVKQHSVEYHLVRGFTASHTHKDTDHCIGTFLHHDFISLHRETPIGRVVITEVDLHTLHPFSHFFIVPSLLVRDWFDSILKLYSHHRHAPYAPHDGFSPRFKDTHSEEVAKCISAMQQHQYIYEVIDNSLFVYNLEQTEPTEKSIDTQVRFSCALATALETRNK